MREASALRKIDPVAQGEKREPREIEEHTGDRCEAMPDRRHEQLESHAQRIGTRPLGSDEVYCGSQGFDKG